MPENAMPDSFIVTVVSGGFETDLEIPSRLTFSEMKEKLLEILKILGGREFQDWRACSLLHRGRALADGETLAGVGAFDGARLPAERNQYSERSRAAWFCRGHNARGCGIDDRRMEGGDSKWQTSR